MAAIKGRLAELWLGSGATSAITKEACEQVAGTIYHVTAAAKRYLDPGTAVLVYDNDVLQTSGYHLEGHCIVFDSAPAALVTVSGKYITPAEVKLVQGWELSFESETYETTSLGDTARTYVGSGLLSWSGSFERFLEDATYANIAAANGTLKLARFFTDQPSGYVWTGWVVPTGWTGSAPISGLDTESFTFQGYGKPIYTTDES